MSKGTKKAKKTKKAARVARPVTEERVCGVLGKKALTVPEVAERLGMPTPYGETKVRGVLGQMQEGGMVGSRCRTGGLGRPPAEFYLR